MLIELLKEYTNDPQILDRANAILSVEYFGLSLPQISGISWIVCTVLFFMQGWDKRSFADRLVDYITVWICILVFFGMLIAGLIIGKQFDNMAIGGFAGLFLFWAVFMIIGNVRQSIKNKEDRKRLAASLQRKGN